MPKSIKFSAPFPYFGGKSRVADIVWKRFGNVSNYVEPFFGSGAMLLGRPGWDQGVAWKETINDKSGFVANFWRAVQSDPEGVAHYADNPVNENDLHARHAWLVQNHMLELPIRLEGDPEFYDAKIAGWWVWGMACWIGGGFCSGRGPWKSIDGKLVNDVAGIGVNRQRIHLGDAGIGVNRQRVHLGDAGQGNAGIGESGIIAWMRALQCRLRRVRVCCGDWSRVMGKAVIDKHGLTSIFLDPPYSANTGRDMAIYEQDCGIVAHDVREWAIANGDDPKKRIALCGYTGEHAMPDGWDRLQWSTQGGYENHKNGDNINQHREVIWFSPHCLSYQKIEQMELELF